MRSVDRLVLLVLATGASMLAGAASAAPKGKSAKGTATKSAKPGKTTTPPPEGRLSYLSNEVFVDAPDHRAGKTNDLLSAGNRIATGPASAAELTLLDGTQLRLAENSELVVFGKATAPKGKPNAKAKASKRLAKASDSTLVKGKLRVIIPPDKATSIALATLAGAVVIGGEAQVEVDGKVTRLLAYRGKARLGGKGSKGVDVLEGFGTRLEKGKKPDAPQRLPPSPQWISMPKPVTLSTEATGDLIGKFEPSSGPGPAPARWHIQVARDDHFNDQVVDAGIDATGRTLTAERLSAGRYYSRASGVGGDGLEGPFGPMATSVVAVAHIQRDGSAKATIDISPAGLRCAVDGGSLAEVTSIEVDAEADHTLRCEAATGGAPAELTFQAPAKPAPPRPPAPSPAPPPKAKRVDDEPLLGMSPEPKPRPESTGTRVEVGISAGAATARDENTTYYGPLVGLEVGTSHPVGSGAVAFALHAGYERYAFSQVPLADIDLVKDVGALALPIEYRLMAESAVSPFLRLSPQLILEYERYRPMEGTNSLLDLRAAVGLSTGARIQAGPGVVRVEVGVRQALDSPFKLGAPTLGLLLLSAGYTFAL